MPKHFEDKPKLLRDKEACVARLPELHEPHIISLTKFVDELRYEKGSDYEIPYFDPWDGGIDAEVLCLFEAPGPQAKGSGFISRNNPDETAKNFFELNLEAKIPRKRTISWNIVPWYIGSGSKIRHAKSNDIEAGTPSLRRVFKFLRKLRVIVLFGKSAQSSEDDIASLYPNIRILKTWHPSPQSLNPHLERREEILAVLREVANYLGI
jgi:hypothetical protein